jgi:hypothetical protein
MLKPSGGFFKKMFHPDRMAQARKKPVAAPAPTGGSVGGKKPGGFFGKIAGKMAARKAY